MKKIFLLTALIYLYLSTAQARSPAPSPNFCAHGLCLEIAQLSRKGVNVKTSSENSASEVVILNAVGITKISYSFGNERACKSEGSIQLRKVDQNYWGHGCISLPGQSAKWRNVTLKFTPHTGITAEASMLGMPVLNIWPVDSSPLSFWEGGYALRVGESIEIKW